MAYMRRTSRLARNAIVDVGDGASPACGDWPHEYTSTNRFTLPTSAMASSHANPQDLRAATRTRLPLTTIYPPSTLKNRLDHTLCMKEDGGHSGAASNKTALVHPPLRVSTLSE